MAATDAMLSRLQAEIDDRRSFQDGLVAAANEQNRDLNTQEMELFTRAQTRENEIVQQMDLLHDAARIEIASRAKSQELAGMYTASRNPAAANIEYRSAGAYIAELYYARMGDQDAQQRLEIFNRAAAHQTTTDNPGLLPELIVSPLVNFIQVARPLVATLGPTDLGSGAWSYAKVTQHTSVTKQSGGEKTELASRKMLVTKTPLGADTFGGYVNLSKQDINRSSPGIMDMVIQDLAEQYAIATELETGTTLTGAATAGPVIPTGTPTPAAVAAAVWAAAGTVFAATKGQGTTYVAVAPDMLGLIGPIFPPTNPTNAYSSGFTLPMGQGPQGSIAGLSVIMSAGLANGTILVYSTAAAKAFEYKYGNMTVDEPSVWGVQVGYAGDFDVVVIDAAGIVKITKTP